jgi:carboxypeptidase Q
MSRLSLLSLSLLAACAAHSPELPVVPEPSGAPAVPEPPVTAQALQPAHVPVGSDTAPAEVQALIALARTEQSRIYARLASLCDGVGHRLAGSPGLEAAVVWGHAALEADGHANVVSEPVMVPAWTRGDESLTVLTPRVRKISMLGLGNSVGTGGDALVGDVVVATSFEELGPEVEGKIVLFDVPMGTTPPMIQHYGAAVKFRGAGPREAARHGAAAVLVRSVTSRSLNTPHTGVTVYGDEVDPIPAAAITTEDAGWIHRLLDAGVPVSVRLTMDAQMGEDAPSHNVVAEIRGRELPDQIVVVGGHLDSWDVGQGAHDDGAGVVESMEALRLIASLDEAPRRTVRVVLFTNEENGLRGGRAYAKAHKDEVHVAAVEIDLGGGWPLSWGASGTDEQMAWLRAAAAPVGLPVTDGGGGADISPMKADGVLQIGLRPDDTHYFDVHHTDADTLDKVDPEALAEATGAVAALVWRLADAPDAPLPTPPAPEEASAH